MGCIFWWTPLPNASSTPQVIPLSPSILSAPVSDLTPISIPHPISTKENQVVELKTTDLDTPLQAYVNEKGENVYEFQIPPVPPIDSPVGGLQRNLASSLVADGGSLDPSKQPWFRVTPGPPISSAPNTAVVDSIMDSFPMDGRRAWTCLCKICGKFFLKKRALLKHVNVHLGFRPFQCRSCEKGFFHKSSLSSHIRNNCLTSILGPPTGLSDSADENDCDD